MTPFPRAGHQLFAAYWLLALAARASTRERNAFSIFLQQALRVNGAPGQRHAPHGVLTTLALHFNRVGDEGAKAIAEALKVHTRTQVLIPL